MRRWRYVDVNDGLVVGGMGAAIVAAALISVWLVVVVIGLVAFTVGLVRSR